MGGGIGMPRKIQILPEHITQAIAAGEVIERPASVVKELMENALDAGSSEITVELKSGGLQLIRVQDNGEGMDPEDVPVALQRYATSKIRQVEDLYAIHTLGFRGEALPSIASVSKMTITTRVPHALSGIKVICEGGEIKSIEEVGCPIGTEVEVQKLFYNIPVKRKFLKSIRSELRHSLNYFFRLGLSHPPVSFKLIHDDRVLYELIETKSPLVRIEAVLGKEIYHHLQPFEFEDGAMTLSGFSSLPTFSKGNNDGIYIYVNQRFVKDRMITRAVLEAYRHVIPADRFPIAILWITLPPYAVDVNVHPTKAEVKFKEGERIFQAVIGTLRSVNEGSPSLSEASVGGDVSQSPTSKDTFSESHSLPSYPSSLPWMEREKGTVSMVREASDAEWKAERKIPFRVLGQIQGTYILCEGEKELIFIDQHAAHERILFETYKKKYESRSIPCVRFLIPILMELSAEESFTLESHREDFQAIGFEMDPVGEKAYAIRSVPAWIEKKDPKGIVKEILDEVSFLKRDGKGNKVVHTLLITLACHSAIRGNLVLRKEEIEELLESLHPFRYSATCPHGRPIFFVIPLKELDRQFKRSPR